MALSAPLTVTAVKTLLGTASNDVSYLCTVSTINKWSRYKPVSGAWPQSSNGNYGLNLSDWSYIKPSSSYRLGDFRGYEHTGLMPIVYSINSNNTVPATLYPSGGVTVASFTYKANSTNNTTRIMPTDLGIQSYYVGIRYLVGSSSWYYKTGSIISSMSEGSNPTIDIDVTVTISGSTGVFANAPISASGTATVQLFISSGQATSWTTTPPGSIYLLPSEVVNGTTVSNSYTFTVAGWTKLSSYSMYWSNSATGSGNAGKSIVATSASSWTVGSIPSWLTAAVYRGGSYVGSGSYYSGDELWLYPTAVNSGQTKTDYTVIGDQSIYCTFQGGTPTYTYSPELNLNPKTATLSIGSASVPISFYIISGVGTTNRYVYYRLYNNTTGTYLGSWLSALTRDARTVNDTLSASPQTIDYGQSYTIYVTLTDPNL
jgi:hypothetical protein